MVFRKVLGRPVPLDESQEAVSYRTSVVGFLFCAFYLIAFGFRAGGTLTVLIVFFLVFFLYSLAIARMRAELGPPAHDLHYAGPEVLLTDALGARNLGPGNLVIFNLFFFFNRAYRAHMSAQSLEAYKIGERLGIRSRSLFWTMIIAILVGLPVTYWALIHSIYQEGTTTSIGVANIFGGEPWNRLAGWSQNPPEPNLGATIAIFVGFVLACGLAALRMRFTWWVFHPVGFATSSTWSMENLWFCMFLGWLLKWTLLRYGGAKAYRPAVPFFIGLVLGDFMIGSCWNLYGILMGKPVYHFWG